MIEQIKVGDKLTVIKVNSLATTSIDEITIDSIHEGKAVYAAKRKKYYLSTGNGVIVLKGHNLGITQGTWSSGACCFIMSGNCNLGGLDREKMIALLKTNINTQFNQWERIYWFDGTSDKGDPVFVPRPVSDNYLRYRKEAEENNTKAAGEINVGDFIYSYLKSSKYNNLMDMLKDHLTFHEDINEYLALGKITAIIEMSEEQFDSLEYMGSEIELPNKGGTISEDIVEDRQDRNSYSTFEHETFYALFTVIRTPSGRAITVDAQGYDYMRYTGLLSHYKNSMEADCAKASGLLHIEEEKAEAEKKAKKAETQILEYEEKHRIEKEYYFLTVVSDYQDQKTAANNLRTLLKVKFPAIKFSVKKHYYDSYIVKWNDGPSEKQVKEITRLFVDQGFDGMTDSSFSITTPFNQRYGGIGYISTDRNISDERKNEELAMLNSELGKSYKMDEYVTEKMEWAGTLVYRRIYKKDFSPVVEQESAAKTPPANPPIKSVSAQGIELIDYSEKSFVITGNTKPIKEMLKQLGGCFNGHLSCGAGWVFSKSKIDIVKQTLSLV